MPPPLLHTTAIITLINKKRRLNSVVWQLKLQNAILQWLVISYTRQHISGIRGQL